MSYGMKSITSISHLRWLSPLWCLTAPPSPAERWDNKDPQSNPFISRTTISTGYSAPACGGSPAERARGNAFPSPAGRLYGFSRQRRHKKWRPKGRPPRQRSDTIYLPRAEALNPSGRRQPIPDRTLAAQGQRPGGWLNPHAHKGVSTFGNTGKRRPADWYLSRDDSLPAYTVRILHRMRESAKVGP